jgi:hypothetical protein
LFLQLLLRTSRLLRSATLGLDRLRTFKRLACSLSRPLFVLLDYWQILLLRSTHFLLRRLRLRFRFRFFLLLWFLNLANLLIIPTIKHLI